MTIMRDGPDKRRCGEVDPGSREVASHSAIQMASANNGDSNVSLSMQCDGSLKIYYLSPSILELR